jgi:hypothetical protein
MRSIVEYIAKFLLWAIALMSGSFSIYRELYGLIVTAQATPNQYQPLTVFERCAVIAFILSAAILWYQERRRFDSKFKGLPQLKLEPEGFYSEIRPCNESRLIPSGGVLVATNNMSCIMIRIVNEPTAPTPESIAKVSAKLIFYDSNLRELFTFHGRWGDTTQPSNLAPNQAAFELLTVEMPIGISRELDVAMKFLEEEDAYGINNDSWRHGQLKDPRWRLSGVEFSVKVSVQGAYVNQAWLAKFRNPGRNRELKCISCSKIKPTWKP